MLIRELKVNFKSFCIWSIITISIFLIVFLVYPSIISSPEMESLDDMMKMFPEDLLKAFNMDISSLDSAYGWLKSEGFVFVLLIINCYAGILGANILLKEENDKTSEYIGILPIRRTNIVISKAIVGVFYIILLTLITGTFNYVSLKISGSFDEKQYILLSLTPLLSALPIFFICLFISTFTNKTKKMLGVSLGIVLISYILNTISSLSEKVEFLKYFSVFTLSDIRNVITKVVIDSKMILICLAGCILFLIITLINYNKKEFV